MRINALFLALSLAACSDKFDEGSTDDLNGASDGADGTGGTDGPIDMDGDGFTDDVDCDDSDSDVYPGAAEYCNGEDDDCDGEIDDQEDLADGQGEERYRDADGDGYGNEFVREFACEESSGWVDNGDDCDDDHSTANPDGTEVNWNGIDEDCDGEDYNLNTCLNQAMDDAAAEMAAMTPMALPDFQGGYPFTIYGVTIPNAGIGQVYDQLALIADRGTVLSRESGNTYSAAFETTLGYNTEAEPFRLVVGINPTYYTYNLPFGLGSLGSIVEGVLSSLYTLPEGFDGTVTCLGYVDPFYSDFDGSVVLTVSESTAQVTAEIAFESSVVGLTEGDVNLVGPGGGQCANDIADALMGYLGYGSTYTFLRQNLQNVGQELVTEYEETLQATIADRCSG